MTEIRLIARCALMVAGLLVGAAANAQAAPSATASSAADRAQKESDRTLYWIRVLAEKPAPKAAAPAAAPKAVAAATPVRAAAEARPEHVKVAASTTEPVATPAPSPAPAPAQSVVTAAPAATAPAVPLATGGASNPAAAATSGGLDAGVSAATVGGGIAAPAMTPPSPPDVAPSEVEEPDPGLIMTKSVDPQFPMNTMKRLRKGQVEVKFEVGPDGQVDVVSVVKTTNPGLNDAALDAVRQWQFKPTPHGHTALVDLAFDLDA